MKRWSVAIAGLVATVVGALILGLSLPASQAEATKFLLTATLDEAQETTCEPNPAPAGGGGSATMIYDNATNMLSWDISFSNLSGGNTAIAAHFHGPAAPGVTAGIRVTINHTLNPVHGTTPTGIAGETISEAEEADLLAGLWYINYHTSACTGGEIRGQVTLVSEVGGIAELPGSDDAPLQASDSSGPNTGLIAGIAAVTAGTVLMGTGAWYARRRLVGERE